MRHLHKLLAACTLLNAAFAQDWNMYLYDPPHSSYVSSSSAIDLSTVTSLQPAWTLSTKALMAAATTVSNGILYVGDWKGNFYAIRADDGTILWQQFVGKAAKPANPACQPAI